MILLSIIIYVITNIANVIIDKLVETNKDYKMILLISNIVIGIIVCTCLISVLSDVGRYMFLILSLAQMFFNESKLKNITKYITIINGAFIALVIAEGTHTVVSSIFSLVALMMVLMIMKN